MKNKEMVHPTVGKVSKSNHKCVEQSQNWYPLTHLHDQSMLLLNYHRDNYCNSKEIVHDG
jgi:hypothetical protein